jgi:hypothetical protein
MIMEILYPLIVEILEHESLSKNIGAKNNKKSIKNF